jgi:hypothetical protein
MAQKEKGGKEELLEKKAQSEPAVELEKAFVVIQPIVVAPAPVEVAPEPVVGFSSWFRVRSKQRGYKPHWIDGMKAFTDTNSPRSMKDWDEAFKAY